LEAKVKDGYRELPFLEKLSRDTIQEATEAVVSEWVMGLVPEIRAAIEKQLGTQKARTALASALVNQLIHVAEHPKWQIKVEFQEPQRT